VPVNPAAHAMTIILGTGNIAQKTGKLRVF
jgi:hypothetical protein